MGSGEEVRRRREIRRLKGKAKAEVSSLAIEVAAEAAAAAAIENLSQRERKCACVVQVCCCDCATRLLLCYGRRDELGKLRPEFFFFFNKVRKKDFRGLSSRGNS